MKPNTSEFNVICCKLEEHRKKSGLQCRILVLALYSL